MAYASLVMIHVPAKRRQRSSKRVVIVCRDGDGKLKSKSMTVYGLTPKQAYDAVMTKMEELEHEHEGKHSQSGN